MKPFEERPYDWLLRYTRQTEWIDRRGILIWLAEVSSGLGAGLYLFSLYFNNLWGMFIGWLILVVLKGGFHLSYLGKPLRFWRFVLKPGTSWLARGFIFMLLFIGFGAIQLALSYWLPGTAEEVVFKGLAGVMAFMVAIYPGFVMNCINSIPLWNSALLPVLFILSGILDGCALMIAIGLFGGHADIMAAEAISRVLLIITAIFLTIYLWSATYMGIAGKGSVIELIKGSIAPVLWGGVVLCGIIIPIIIAISSHFAGEASAPLLIVAIGGETTGAFALKYCILKAGIYTPLIATSAH
jgi:formate-dependent nitrite reductase membrane component NrfD